MNHKDLWNKTLKHIERCKACDNSEEKCIYTADLRNTLIAWIKAFKKGECHTDFAADNRKGQENIIEWIEHVFEIKEDDLK